MGRILLKDTNKGDIYLDIEGDSPTDAEKAAISKEFFSTVPTKSQIDYATASLDEIREYNKKRAELEGRQEGSEEVDSLKDPDVDYTSGLQNLTIRTGLANKELASEKAEYLKDVLGSKGFRQDKGGRFILTKEGRKTLGLAEGPEIAIDEEGFSRYDIADFVGEAGVPIGFGIVGGILTGGMAALPAMALVGGSMALGKIVDETLEWAQGYQKQTKGDLARDVAFEGAMGFLGEGIGRGISAVVGRFLKGASTEAVEQSKELGREMLKRGYRPSVEGAAPGAFSILSRVQAVYEGVIPNKTAALKNVEALKKDLQSLGMDKTADLEALSKILKDDIDKLYRGPEETFRQAQQVLDGEIDLAIKKIIDPLRSGRELNQSVVQGLKDAKRSFKENSDALFKAANDTLGEDSRIIPVGELADDIYRLSKNNQAKNLLTDNVIGIFSRARTAAIAKAKNSGKYQDLDKLAKSKDATDRKLYNEIISRETYISPSEAQILREVLSDIQYNPAFVTTLKGLRINNFNNKLEMSFKDGAAKLKNRIAEINTNKIQGPANVEQLDRGLTLLNRARKYYAIGLEKFKDAELAAIIKNARDGSKELDITKIVGPLVRPNEPQRLSSFLRAVKGVKPLKEKTKIGDFDVKLAKEEPTIRFDGEDISIAKAKEELARLQQAGLTRAQTRELQADISKAERDLALGKTFEKERAARDTKFGQFTQRSETIRRQLASQWTRDLLDDPLRSMSFKKGVQVYDGIKIARQIDALGKTKDVLFRGELKELNELLTLLKSTGTEFDRGIVEGFANQPLAQAIQGLSQATRNFKAVKDDAFLKNINKARPDDIMDRIFIPKKPLLVSQFMNNNLRLGDDVVKFSDEAHDALKRDVQNEAMGRILRSLGDVNSAKFSEDFLSGKMGGDLFKTLDNYGEETLTAMFGKKQTSELFKLSEIMKRASQEPLAGKGGLAAPTIALGLTVFGVLQAPLVALPTLLYYTAMSSLLRKPSVLKMLTSSRRPGAGLISTVTRDIQTEVQKANVQLATSPEGPFAPTPEQNVQIRKAVSPVTSSIPNVAPATVGTVGNIDPTNPIITPNPMDQALAQRLAGTSAISPRLPN